MQDWKSSDLEQARRHAEDLCQELHEDQIEQLLSMEKFKAAASCNGETATINVKKLSGEARVEFFTMMEDMVMANRKKVSIPVAASKPVKAGPPTPVPKPATQTVVDEPVKVPENEAAHAPQHAAAPLPPAPVQKISEAAPAGPVDAPLPNAAPVEKTPEAAPAAPVDARLPKVGPVEKNSEAAPAAPLDAPLPKAAPVEKNSEAAPAAPDEERSQAPAPKVAPVQKNSNADLARLVEVKPSGHAGCSVADDPAVPATVPQPTMALQPAPDRTLELNGLQALMAAQKGREQQSLSLAQSAALTPATEKLDWSTHKKEGMRLKRLMEESSEGEKFPRMKKLFNEGSKEDSAQQMGGYYGINYIYIYILFFVQ